MVRSPIRLSSPLLRYAAQGLDVFVIVFCAVLAWVCTQPGVGWANWDMPAHYDLLVLAASLAMLVFSSEVYRSWRFDELQRMLRTVGVAWLTVVVLMVVWMFSSKSSTDYSRVWFGAWVIAVLALMGLQRLAAHSLLRWVRSKGYNYKTVVLVGVDTSVNAVQEALAQAVWTGLRVVARVVPERLASALAGQSDNDELVRKPDWAPSSVYTDEPELPKARSVDEVWLCIPMSDEKGIRTALDALKHSTANVRMIPDIFSLRLINHGVSEVAGIPMLDLSTSPMTGPNRLFKAAEDYVAASIILLAASPVMLGIAVAIKLTSPGPIFYKQLRHGWNGKEIWVYKFRSMCVHQEAGTQVTQATKGDARITPLGAFLRRTSLDELPQFINVLQGRMSVVGPRPHAVEHNEYYKELVPGYMLRHKVKPGVTGWAQVNGHRGETDTIDKMRLRVEHDLHYIENWSLSLDLHIIFKTLFKGFTHKNAY